MQECCLSLAPETGVPMFLDDRVHRPRPGQPAAPSRGPWGLYPCSDGFVSFLVIQPAHWRAMAAWIAEATGMDSVLDEAFNDMHVRWEVSDFIDELTEQLTRPRHEARAVHRGAAAGASRSRRSTPSPTSAAIRTCRAPGSGATTSTRCSARSRARARRSA